MNSVLIVSSTEKGKVLLKELLTLNSYKEIMMANNGGEARRILIEKEFDMCLINAPLSDEFGTELALNIVNKTMMQVMIIVKSELEEDISLNLEGYGVFVVSKPINRQVFWNALKLITASHNRMIGLKNENIQLQKKIEDIRFIDRAKYALIEYLKMTETEAHRFIEKQSMDMRITRREVAASILKTYES
jgi:response regulator NasT